MPEQPDLAMAAFGLAPAEWQAQRTGDGSINPTWFLRPVASASDWQWLLQQINPEVFPDPARVVRNQARILTAHALAGLAEAPALVPLVPVPENAVAPRGWRLLPERLGWLADDGSLWRLQPFVGGSRTLPRLDNLEQAWVAGRAFGALQRALGALSPAQIEPPLPHFHELDWQMQRLDGWVSKASQARRRTIASELTAIDRQRDLLQVQTAGPQGLIHGDCKLSNLLFDRTGQQVIAVIDLDTVMWGRRAWDYGDLARSALSGADETGLAGALPAVPLLLELGRGFLDGLADPADQHLRAAMVQAPRYIALMLAIRFLLDHLDGDRYFRVGVRGQNLARARRQLELCVRLAELEPALCAHWLQDGVSPPA